jgi:hypothetical protein
VSEPEAFDPTKVALLEVNVRTLDGKLSELASNTERQFTALRTETHSQFLEMRRETAGSIRSVVEALGDLQKSVAAAAAASATQGKLTFGQILPAVGTMTGVLALVGGILYAPIAASISRLEADQRDIKDKIVHRAEYLEDRRTTERDLDRSEILRQRSFDFLDKRIDRLESRRQTAP